MQTRISFQRRIYKFVFVIFILTGLVGCKESVTTPAELPEPTKTQEEIAEPVSTPTESPEPTKTQEETAETIDSFEECVAVGMPVMESYPQQCQTDDGRVFVEDIGNAMEKVDLIQLDTPHPNQVITSPLHLEGQARGVWFFEGDFPVKLLDEKGEIIAEHYLTARGEWMTEDFVQFSGELVFTTPEAEFGTLVLEKDNPSGLPEHGDALIVPIRFRQSQ
jgi:hypothetical protein